ncbi:MAG TPA: DUF3105 domain-containing protein [Spirillospora sp.]|nr:DUF3105 domain-containing protein [Spirillospora sp.]
MSKSRTRQRREIKQAANRSRNLLLTGVAVVAVVVIGVAVFLINRSQQFDVDVSTVPDNSVTYPSLGQTHIPEGSPRPTYNSNPPTSGDHYANWVPTRVYSEVVPDELMVHNLEHGHIWLSYRDADDTEAIETLTQIQSQSPNWIVVTYRPENDDRIAVASWGRLLTLDEPDEAQILAFVARYRNQAPESIPG